MALGAKAGQVVAHVVGSNLVRALPGIPVGIAATLLLGRGLGGALFGVRPSDPLTLSAATLLVTVVAIVAVALPARVAARTDPATVTKSD
jgi:putative ABC transport system permease protein